MWKKKVLIIGSGGREHALGWKIRQTFIGCLYFAPGNGGTDRLGLNVPIKATDIEGLLAFALKEKIDFTIVGQDDPLAMGIVDAFQEKGLRIFGPTKAAAEIESSKVFAKSLMVATGVPTAYYTTCKNVSDAMNLVRGHFMVETDKPIVIKADGLALGKGAYVCENPAEAEKAIDDIMVKRIYGNSGDQVVIESFLEGAEYSMHAFSDGKTFKMFPSSRDHKAIFNGDKGPNTGGMGTIAPVPGFNQEEYVSTKIVSPILAGLQSVKRQYVGLLYTGIKGKDVLEFNARFGDPETQVYMRLLKTDLLEILEACVDGRLDKVNIEWNPGFAACIVIASEGYPSPNYKKGVPILGIDRAENLPGVVVFHAGTKIIDGGFATSGGRVLGVTGVGATLQEALYWAYKGVNNCIHFEGMQFRTDIGTQSLALCKK